MKTYRHRVTGVVREYPADLARVFDDLEEVSEDVPCITCHPSPAEVEKLMPKRATKPRRKRSSTPKAPIIEPASSADNKED